MFQAPHDLGFCNFVLQEKAATDVSAERISASVALVGALQALAIPRNKMLVGVAEEKPTFVTVLKNTALVWETLCRDFMAA